MIEELSSLARERSSDKRRELLGRVADLFFEGAEHYSDQEMFLFGDVLTSLLDNADASGKVDLSRRVAEQTRAPHQLAKTLASDEQHEVATPILQFSSALMEEDIVEIARHRSQTHLMAISKRSELGERITDVLVERGERPVLQSVVENRGAQFSANGFASLVHKAVADDALKEALSHRGDMPADAAERLVPMLSDDACSRLLELMNTDPEKGAQLVHLARTDAERQKLLAKKRRLEAKVMAEDIKTERLDLNAAIGKLSDENRVPDLALVLAKVSDMAVNILTNILLKSDAEPIAMLCRSLDVTPEAFHSLVEMRARRTKAPASQARKLTTEYAKLDKATADRAIRFIRMRASMAKSGSNAAA